MSKQRFIALASLCGVVMLFVFLAKATVIPRNPTAKEVTGTWVGWFDDRRYFRLKLAENGTGLFGDYNLSDTNPKPKLYQITKWSLEGAKLAMDLHPIDPDASPLALSAHASVTMLRLTVTETNGWTGCAMLRPEPEIDSAIHGTKSRMEDYEAAARTK